jgi:myo-inositol-1(or 4)-monophosphatase
MNNEYKDFAIKIAYEAGVIMRNNFTLSMKKEWKHDHTPVTATDIEINALVLQKIKETYPEHDVLSEEGDSDYSGSEYVWICDPVDGTHNFSHGIPTSTFVLALTFKGMPWSVQSMTHSLIVCFLQLKVMERWKMVNRFLFLIQQK